MSIEVNTPALLFPAISLMMLAYTNRFVVLANLIRNLHDRYIATPHAHLAGQIKNLRQRVGLIKYMQAAGVLSMLLCVLCMFLVLVGQVAIGNVLFCASLLLLMISLGLCVTEIWISGGALNLALQDMEER